MKNVKIVSFIIIVMLILNRGFIVYGANAQDYISTNSNQNVVSSKIANRNYVKNQVIVKYKGNVSNVTKQSTLSNIKSLNTQQINEASNQEVVNLSSNETVEQALDELNKDKNVEFAQPNYIYNVNDFSNEPLSDYQWGILNSGQNILSQVGQNAVDISLRDAWNMTQGDSQVVVGVVDTGIDINHPDLKNRIWVNPNVQADMSKYPNDINGWDFYNNDNSVFDVSNGDNHGTHVAGIIAASLNNMGVVGVSPNVKIMSLKFIGPNGGTTDSAIKAIQYAVSKGVKILNFSFGENEYDYAFKDAIESSGCLIITAAGNDGINNDANPEYPASFNSNNIISVTAVDNQGNLASFSNYGVNSVDVAAPGVNILSTVPKDSNSNNYNQAYAYYSGTSMATPFVTGIAALLYSYGVHDPLTIKQYIMQSCKAIPSLQGKVSTSGMVDAYNALMMANPLAANETKFNRLASSDRYATALQICKAGWSTSDYAVLAAGSNFPDALSAAPLAKKYNAPILLTESKGLTAGVSEELDSLKVKQVFVVGGTASISSEIENALKQKNISVIRLSGEDRYGTSLAIANYLGSSNKVFVVSGENFPDAVSIASYAAAKGIPILLSQRNKLPEGISNYISKNNVINTYVIGGSGAINDSVFYELPNAERIYGSDRYETNYEVLQAFDSDFNLSYSYFASGENFPDALAGSAIAANTNSPIILIGSNSNVDINSFIRSNLSKMTTKQVLGGEGVLPSTKIKGIFG